MAAKAAEAYVGFASSRGKIKSESEGQGQGKAQARREEEAQDASSNCKFKCRSLDLRRLYPSIHPLEGVDPRVSEM